MLLKLVHLFIAVPNAELTYLVKVPIAVFSAYAMLTQVVYVSALYSGCRHLWWDLWKYGGLNAKLS